MLSRIERAVTDRLQIFDLLRGYFILVLIIDHLERWPGVFDWITGQGRLWASAAEGFFIVSGIMIGLVRGQRMLDKPLREVTKKLLERSIQLYLWAIAVTLIALWLVTIWPYAFHKFPPGVDSFVYSGGLGFLWEIVSLQSSFGWASFLQYYAVYLAFSPIALWLLRKRLWWVALLISALIWASALGSNDMWRSWQLLFFGGAILGFYVYAIRDFWHKQSGRFRRITSGVIVGASALTLALSVFWTFAWNYVRSPGSFMSYETYLGWRQMIDPLFLRAELLPPKLIIVALWFTALVLVVNRFQQHIQKYLGWLLLPFGHHSLYAYVVQGILVIVIDGLLPYTTNVLLNALIIATSVTIVWLLTKYKVLMGIIPR